MDSALRDLKDIAIEQLNHSAAVHWPLLTHFICRRGLSSALAAARHTVEARAAAAGCTAAQSGGGARGAEAESAAGGAQQGAASSAAEEAASRSAQAARQRCGSARACRAGAAPRGARRGPVRRVQHLAPSVQPTILDLHARRASSCLLWSTGRSSPRRCPNLRTHGLTVLQPSTTSPSTATCRGQSQRK